MSKPTNSQKRQFAQRLWRLRRSMQVYGVDACLIPKSDPHLSEYVPVRWDAAQWLCGFDGSAATMVITADAATLWTDSRYSISAQEQLTGTGVEPKQLSGRRSTDYLQWMCEEIGPGRRIAVDGGILSLRLFEQLRKMAMGNRIRLRTDLDLVNEAWSQRPEPPNSTVAALAQANELGARQGRLTQLRTSLDRADANWHLVSALDQIAWLTGLRGSDIPFSPVFLAHLLVGPEQAILFTDATRLQGTVARGLEQDGFDLAPYEAAPGAVRALGIGTRLLVDPDHITANMVQHLPSGITLVEGVDPCSLLKAVKEPNEIAGIEQAMEQDGAALCEFFAWLEEELPTGELTEFSIDEKLTIERARRLGFQGKSFATIAGFNAHGAMPHYQAGKHGSSKLRGDGLLLLDSGGQYSFGTTNVTRIVAVGKVSASQKHDATLVLKGMIALSRAKFPVGTRAPMLDAIARSPLWQAGLDYGNGAGDGVGCFLNMHEGPASISYRAEPVPQLELKPGMISSIEPGIYREGQWGVRWENLVVVVPAKQAPGFLEFETLTLCPIDTRCLDLSLLSVEEVTWLDGYHASVRERLAPHLGVVAIKWLEARTAPLRGGLSSVVEEADFGADMDARKLTALAMNLAGNPSPREFAERFDFSHTVVYQWLDGSRVPSFEMAARLAEAAGLPPVHTACQIRIDHVATVHRQFMQRLSQVDAHAVAPLQA